MKVAVIGAGYVGLTTAVCLSERGHEVVVAEQNQERRDVITRGKAPFFEPLLEELLADALTQKKLSVVADVASALRDAQITFIAVGTPFDGKKIDLTYVSDASADIGRALISRKKDNQTSSDYHVIVVKSTVVPGTTDTLVREQIEQHSGMNIGQFGLCMNPEFLREGQAVSDFRDPDRIIIGASDERAGRELAKLYEGFSCPFLHTTLREAELTKYSSNALLSLLVSFSNELAALCESFPGTDIDVVLDGLHLDKRLSPIIDGKRVTPEILSYLRAGCGFGGSCLPKDVNALRSFARSRHVPTPLLDATIKVNEERPARMMKILETAIGSLNEKEIAVLGLAFKPNTDDVRESPALKIIETLLSRGCRVRAYDPLVSSVEVASNNGAFKHAGSVEEASAGSDAIIIVTAWQEFKAVDWQQVVNKMKQPIIVDGRRLLTNVTLPPNAVYHPVGAHDSANPKRQLRRDV